MDLWASGLQQQPFRAHGQPLVFVSYEAQQNASAFLQDVCKHRTGIGLLHGPPLSGKTTLVRTFVDIQRLETDVALVDGGAELNTTTLLENVLDQFGYDLHFDCVNELINMLKVYLLQRTASAQTPLIVIENANLLNPRVLRVLSELAELRVREKSAVHLILVSNHSISGLIEAPALQNISKRLIGEFALGPMAQYETSNYLHEKLRAGGCDEPASVIPDDVCDEFHIASGGWPGILDRIVLLALANAAACPLGKEHVEYPALPEKPQISTRNATGRWRQCSEPMTDYFPRLFLTRNGQTLKEISIDSPRLIMGRSQHNDLHINDKFISRHHAMFIRNGKTTFLMDLNSTNGTFVNSRRVSNQVMLNNDVITLGDYRVKFVHPIATGTIDLVDGGMADTVIMKNLKDMRRMLAQENTQAMPLSPHAEVAGFEKNR
jgi:type II secretory pathway predicted ATPase ExeA